MAHYASMTKLSTRFIYTAILAAPMFLCACREPAATPALSLPTMERPITALKTSSDPSHKARILIPRGAYVERGGLPGVYVLHAGQARFRMVHVGKINADQMEVLSGLAGDETLVLGDLADIHDGSPITAK